MQKNSEMSNKRGADGEAGQPIVYEIRIKGHLARQWAGWFEGLNIYLEDDGSTLLIGPVVDQAALHGILRKVRDLGIPLLSVNSVEASHRDLSEVE